jgi:hypothetical protein
MKKKYTRNLDLISADLDDDLVILDVEQGKYFSLNLVSKRIWELLEIEHTKAEVVELLMTEFEVELAECQSEVEIHFKKLVKLKLIK